MPQQYEKNETPDTLSISFPSELDLVPRAVNDALSFVLEKAAGIDQFSFKLALFESLTNAAKHGCHFNPELAIKLNIEIKKSSVDIVIADDGEGFDWRKQLKDSEEPQDAEIASGRGLFILKSYNFNPSYNDKGNVLSLRIELA